MKSKWRTLTRKGWFLSVVIILAVLVGGGVYAAAAPLWQTAQMVSSGGTLTVGNAVTGDANAVLNWTINGTTVTTGSTTTFPITFADCTAAPNANGNSYSTTTTISVKNTGNTNISGWQISSLDISNPLGEVNGVGMGVTLSVSASNTPIAAGATGTVTLTLSGVTPAITSSSNTYNFNGITFCLTPTGP
jgi:hypothetical protein